MWPARSGWPPGERFVDIGCGFGGFMFRAWETTGALGTGINTTTEQAQWLDAEIGRRGLREQLRVREADFREVDQQYDKVVSIGVLEHAGRDQLAEVIKAHADFLKPGGLGMLHFIGHVGRRDTELFIRKHVFPGGWIPSLADAIVEMERFGLEVIDVENLRRHYALTLDAWAQRFAAELAGHPGAGPGALQRALPAHLDVLPGGLRRDVPQRDRPDPSVPGAVQQGQHQPRQLSDDAGAPVWTRRLATMRAGSRWRRPSCARPGRPPAPSRCASARPTCFATAAATPGTGSTWAA